MIAPSVVPALCRLQMCLHRASQPLEPYFCFLAPCPTSHVFRPKKADEKRLAEWLVEFLTAQNRPFNVTQLVDASHGELKGTLAKRLLEELAAQNRITEKAYGKQKIYVARQDLMEIPDGDQLADLDAQISSLTKQVREEKETVTALTTETKKLGSSLTNSEIDERTEALTQKHADLEQRLEELRGGQRLVTEEEMDMARTKREVYVKEWRKRRRLCKDIVDMMAEGMDKKPKDVMKLLNIETDKAAGVDLDDLH